MTHAKPPATTHLIGMQWLSKMPGEEPTGKSLLLPRGWEVREYPPFREGYWKSLKMHTAAAEICQANDLPLPTEFSIILGGEVVGCGHYGSDELEDRVMTDCIIREAEWEYRGCGYIPAIGVDMTILSEDQRAEFARRTGARKVGVAE
jgi:hypothetical protein